jgi:hypothetical protein
VSAPAARLAAMGYARGEDHVTMAGAISGAWAAARGCTHLYLQAEAANVAAVSVYEAFGFRVAGRYHLRTKA